MTDTPVETTRTIYMSDDTREALDSIGTVQDVPASALIRKIFDDYLSGKLVVVDEKPRKTSIWIDPEKWEQLRERTSEQKISIAKVIEAGARRLRGR